MVILYWLCAILEWNNSEPTRNDSELTCDSTYNPIKIEPIHSIHNTDYFFFNEDTGEVHKI
jgi:hypothetical protein